MSEIVVMKLRALIERIERMEKEKTTISEGIKEIYYEAKSSGFDVKIIRAIVRIRKLNADDRMEQEAILDTYMHALGMVPETTRAEVSLPSGMNLK